MKTANAEKITSGLQKEADRDTILEMIRKRKKHLIPAEEVC